jgi:Ca2+/Na+ antiporter
VKSYPLAEGTIRRELRRAFIRFQIAVMLILLILAGYLFADPPLRWVVGLPIFMVVLAVYVWITIYHFRRERSYLQSLRVDLTDRDLRLYAGSRPPSAVTRDDVFAVQEMREGLYVSTYDYHEVRVPFGWMKTATQRCATQEVLTPTPLPDAET